MKSVTPSMSGPALADLQRLLEANPAVDWRAVSLSGSEPLAALEWRGLSPLALAPLLLAYQRLLRVLPIGEEQRATPLLEDGLHSAIQIASMARDEFARRWSALFPGEDALGEAVHGAALNRRAGLLLHYIDGVQRNEPHYRAARFK